MNGYIKLYRSLLENEWHDDPITTAVWVYCLLRANFETARWHGIVIQPGQFVTSLNTMAKEIGITVSQLRTAINHLKSTRQLTKRATKSATLITIENWAVYQSAGEKVTKSLTKNVTSESHAVDKQIATNKERKERKEEKENININARANFTQKEHMTVKLKDGSTVEYVRGVPQFTEAESNEILNQAHDMFAPVKATIALEAEKRIKEREVTH